MGDQNGGLESFFHNEKVNCWKRERLEVGSRPAFYVKCVRATWRPPYNIESTADEGEWRLGVQGEGAFAFCLRLLLAAKGT